MGLDMYLYKAKRINGYSMSEVVNIENYLDWQEYLKQGKECTFNEWCGSDKIPSVKNVELYKKELKTTYFDWDKDKNYPRISMVENVGYWRKANQIHKWFVDNIQNGNDNCKVYDVSKAQLEELLDICKQVQESIELIDGEIQNGYTFDKEGNQIPIIEKGKYIKDWSVCEELLPTEEGFFFGSQSYDQYYKQDIDDTIEILEKVISETNWATEMVAYTSSW